MGRKAVGPMCLVMHVKEPSALIKKEKGFAPVFLAMAAECAVAPCQTVKRCYITGSQNSSLQ